MYAKCFKRALDIFLSFLALSVLSPLFVLLMAVGAVAMGGNPFFVQPRPGKKDKFGNEKIFNLIKFRTMNNKRDKNGNLLPDEQRLTKYGRFLRSTSLDEFPEAINILKGDMSVVGPRPQLVRDMVFMTEEQRNRHNVRPGLSGLAQVRGRNNILWSDKLNYDLEYIKNITFFGDVKLVFETVWKAFVKQENISAEGMATAEDFGDWLLESGKIDKSFYEEKQAEAKRQLSVYLAE